MFTDFLKDFYVGQILMHLLFGASLTSLVYYILAIRGNVSALRIARILFYTLSGGIVFALCLNMMNVMTSDFQYTYVWSYSNKDLPTWYLMAAGYAGQEGSFLLWTVWVALIGSVLIPYVRKRGWEAEVMVFYSLILVFLLLLLIVKNPFAYIWDSFAKDGIAKGIKPPDGRGLNPLLHNVWITIHPPILFTGFAALSVPFAFAMAALIKRKYDEWIDAVLPWTLYATAILGFGIMLGGFWAYETLGWGGYWAWDPVENSSLIPWLTSVALVHTMLVQRKTKGLIRTNILLALFSFILVLYSTFLTRSGVLGDTSVHSFVDPGMFAYVILLIFMSTFIALGVGMMIWRLKDFIKTPDSFAPQSREFLLSIGSSFTLMSALIVLLGTSYPLIAEILGLTKVALDQSFYNRLHIPLVTAILLINGLSLAVRWRAKNFGMVFKKMIFPLGMAVIATIASYILGVRDWWYIPLAFASWFALFVNAELALKIIRSKFSSAGAYISHAGIAFLMLGILATSRYSVKEHARMEQGKPISALGYTLTYVGKNQIDVGRKDQERYKYFVEVRTESRVDTVAPIMFWSDFNKRQAAFQEPGISWAIDKDVYVSPKVLEMVGELPKTTLKKGMTIPIPTDTSLKITFTRFDMSGMRGGAKNGGIRPGALITVTNAKGDTNEYTLYANITVATMETMPEPFIIPGTTQQIAFTKLDVNREILEESGAMFTFYDTTKPENAPKEVFTAEVSIKPLINLVWFGVIAMVGGFFISIFRHGKKKIKTDSEEREPKDVKEVEEITT